MLLTKKKKQKESFNNINNLLLFVQANLKVNQAIYRLTITAKNPNITNHYVLDPLRALKQILSFFVSLNEIECSKDYPGLTNFILNKRENYLPEDLQLFAYFNNSNKYRYLPYSVNYTKGIMYHYSEIAHFPLGFILSFKRTNVPIDNRLVEITYWKNFTYDERNVVGILDLNELPIELAMVPGDFRTRQQIENTIKTAKDFGLDK